MSNRGIALKGDVIRELRLKKGWQPTDLALAVVQFGGKLSGSAIGKIETKANGALRKNAEAIAKALGVPLTKIRDFEPIPEQKAPPIVWNHDPAQAIPCPRCGGQKWTPRSSGDLGPLLSCDGCGANYTATHLANIEARKSERKAMTFGQPPRTIEVLKLPGQVGALVDDGKAATPGVEVVGDLTRQLLEGMGLPGLIPLLEHQLAKGLEKYKTPLMTHNGRSALGDAIWEGVDQLNYLVQLRAELSDAYQALEGALTGERDHHPGAVECYRILSLILGLGEEPRPFD